MAGGDVDEGDEDDLIDDGTDGVCDTVDVALADDSSASGGAARKVSSVGSRHEMVPSLRVEQHAQRAVVTLYITSGNAWSAIGIISSC